MPDTIGENRAEKSDNAYGIGSWLFLRALALIYGIAFISFWYQADALIGSAGILPAADFLKMLEKELGWERFWLCPSLLWLNQSDLFLYILFAVGTIGSLLAVLGFYQRSTFIVLWLIYLSITAVGQDFSLFFGDRLLLEVGFLALFIAPQQCRGELLRAPSPVVLLLLKCLIFRLMFSAGIIHLRFNEGWWPISVFEGYYLCQPLPSFVSYYAHHAPQWLQRSSAVLLLFIELLASFLVFAPRTLRHLSGMLFIGLELYVLATGNYGWLPLLIIAVTLTLFDDRFHSLFLPKRFRETAAFQFRQEPRVSWLITASSPLVLVIFFVSSVQLFSLLLGSARLPAVIAKAASWTAPFHLVNTYQPTVIKAPNRFELIVEGSNDLKTWKAYQFHWKPGSVRSTPPFAAAHLPRLDWQMQLAALRPVQHSAWFFRFLHQLLSGTEAASSLLKENPFEEKPPQYLRVLFYGYTFSNNFERETQGIWWKRELMGLYVPQISLESFKSSAIDT